MVIKSQKNVSTKSVKEHCIDLPGEKVQCWIGGGNKKLKVILRKHRDVVFDINIGNGKVYSLEATESDFYNTRDKKLIFAARHGRVTFQDGEKLHVWIARGFRGALVVSSEGHVVSRITPKEWDSTEYGDSPKEKPAPIIVAIHSKIAVNPAPSGKTLQTLPKVSMQSPSLPVRPAAAPIQDENCPIVCVVDGSVKGMPAEILAYFKKGGGESGLVDIDPNEVATRNWIWGQGFGTAAYVKDNWEWLRACMGKTSSGFRLVKAKVHFVRGKVRFYFSGFSKSNTFFGPGGFSPTNDRIMTLFSGAGETKSTFAATAKGIAGTFKGMALVSFIFGSVTAIAEWKDDAKKDGYDLAATLIMTAVKAVISAALVTFIVAGIIAIIMIVVGGGVSVLVIGVITLIVSLGVGYGIEAADKAGGRAITQNKSNGDGLASVMAPALREANQIIEKNWNYLMSKMSGDYEEIRFDNAM